MAYFQGTSHSTPVYCSEVVKWLSEYRVFVMEGEIVGIKHYCGDPTVMIDLHTVSDAVNLLTESNQGTVGYAVDFGVVEGGITALVEWNDGFSLGSYGLDKRIYTELILTRWCELTKALNSEFS